MTGGVVSTTVTVKPQLVVLPLASLAVQLTAVIPVGKGLPEDGVQITVTFGSQLSVAVVTNRTTVPEVLVHSATRFGGQVIAGGVVSVTLTTAIQVLDAFWLSVTVSITGVVPRGYGPCGVCVSVTGPPLGSKEPTSTLASAEQFSPATTT